MDFSAVIIQLLGALWPLIPLAIIAYILKSHWFKGVVGEFVVNASAKLFLGKDEYHLFKDVTLRTEDGSTQIDHVIVSEFGVFAIETKNMKGWIFGGPYQRSWTQKIYKHTSKFQNPLHQNYKHTKTLETLLGLDESQVHSLIVFVGDNTFKTKMPNNVIRVRGFTRFIKSKQIPVLSKADVARIVGQIKANRLSPSLKTNREHVKHVRDIVASKEKDPAPKCPKCSGPMVTREAKRGRKAGTKFWGCTKFPRCRGMVRFETVE